MQRGAGDWHTPVARRIAMSKRGSAAASGSATKKAKSTSVSLDISEVTGNTNTEYYANLAAAYNQIVDHPLFEDILDQKPVSITAGAGSCSGHEAPFCQKAFATAMAEKGHYKCGFNIMSINWLWSATPRVPIRLGAIRNLERHYFATPGVFPGSARGGLVLHCAPGIRMLAGHRRPDVVSVF